MRSFFNHARVLRLLPFLLYVPLAGITSRFFPMPNADEVVDVVVARNLVEGHGSRFSLYDDIFPPDVQSLGDLSNMDGRTFFGGWLGLCGKLFPMDAWRMRWPSFLMGFAALFFISTINSYAPWILLSSPVFWLGTMVVNEHILLLAVCCMLVAWQESEALPGLNKELVSGLILGLAALIHPNTLIFFVGYVFFVASKYRFENVLLRVGTSAAGFLIGLLIDVQCVNLKRILLYQRTLYGSFLKPAFLSLSWNPWPWARSVFTLIGQAPTYYVQMNFSPDWLISQRLFWIACFVVFVGLLYRRRAYLLSTRFAVGLSATFLAFTFFFVRPEALYTLVLLPFLALVVSNFLMAALQEKNLKICFGVIPAVCFLCSAAFYFRATRQYEKLNSSFAQNMTALDPHMTGHERVAGPTVLWLLNPKSSFRDLGAVVVGRYMTSQPWDLSVWLGTWKPTLLVADNAFRHIYLDGTDDASRLTRAMKVPVTFEKAILTAAYGRWVIYRVHWPTPKETALH